MPKTRKQKEETVAKLKEATKDAASVVFVGFDRLKVSDERVLRKSLREVGATYTVAKKSLLKLAIENFADFPGQVGIACLPAGALAKVGGADAIAPAKGIALFAKKHEGVMKILGGIFEGKLMDAVAMQAIAAIPTRKELLSMLANVLNAPIRGLAIALSEVAKQKS
ncbi:MAG TPA: 50S ribosomal protein L10 [Candidatus Paceibacterota bacterium]